MSLFNKSKNFKKQGDTGLALAIAWFAKNEFTVCLPLTDSQDYDLIVESEGELKRVQVRTTTQIAASGKFMVNLRVLGGNRSGTGVVKKSQALKYDVLFVVTDHGDQYLIPKCDIERLSSLLTLNDSTERYRVS